VEPATHATWAREFAARARAYWTPERTRDLIGDKQLEILPAEAPLLLRALGLLHRDASMPPAEHRKYFQINHVVRVLRPTFRELCARHPTLRLVDAGCGRSYLTLLVAWCARHRWDHRLEVLGIDRDPDVIEECRRRTAIAELDDVVRFEAASLGGLDVPAAWARAFGEPQPIHGVVSLHACDTATCDAIALGVAQQAELIAVAPCCQAELARGWSALAAQDARGAFAPLWRTPHLRREITAHLTDTMRALLLRAAGYDVAALEFIAAAHTKKNTLLRATRGAADPAARAEYDALVAATGGCGLALAGRI